jgi:hypothetical protein
MKVDLLQKTTWLCVVGGLALVMVTALVMKLAAGSPKVEAVHIINPAQVNVTYPAAAPEAAPPLPFVPEAGEPAPMPPFPAADPDGDLDETPQGDPLRLPSA